METIAGLAFAFLFGLTLAGLVGAIAELAAGRPIGFAEPFVSPSHIPRSLLLTAAAGPFMLANDTLGAWRYRRVGFRFVALGMLIASSWALASGILLVALVSAMVSATN